MDRWSKVNVVALIYLSLAVGLIGFFTVTATPAPSRNSTCEPGGCATATGYCTDDFYLDGTTPVDHPTTGASSSVGTAGQDPAAFLNSLTLTNKGLCIEPGTYTPLTSINVATGEKIQMIKQSIIDGSALAANVFEASGVNNFAIAGGTIKSKASFVGVDVTSGSFSFQIKPDVMGGGGGGVYIHGGSLDGVVSVYAESLGAGIQAGNPAGTDGVPVYTDFSTLGITVPYSINIGRGTVGSHPATGTINAWAGGFFAGTDINVGQVYVNDSAGGAVRVGDLLANPMSRRISVSSIIGDFLNTFALMVVNVNGVNIGQVTAYKTGAFSLSGVGEPGVNFYANWHNVIVGGIIANASDNEGVVIGTADAHNVDHLQIGSIIAQNNFQGGAGSGGQCGVYVIANSNQQISNVYINSIQGFDNQAVHTQKYAFRAQSTAGATLANVTIGLVTGSGNTVSLISTSYSGTTTNVYVGTGIGSLPILGSSRLTGQTGTVASIVTFTPPTDATSVMVTGMIQVSAFTSGSVLLQTSYTDPFNNPQTLTIVTANSQNIFNGNSFVIDAKAGTAITMKTTGTFTLTYNVVAIMTLVSTAQ